MSIKDIVILGAGPCGLSTAIALSKMSALTPDLSLLRITLIETRPALQTIGGTINMTPLAMRYLDHLGASQQLKDNSEAHDQVQLKFSDQSTISCDVLLGCDGVNSAARNLYVEPTRKKEYSGRGQLEAGWSERSAHGFGCDGYPVYQEETADWCFQGGCEEY
jgi:2-polyprenyl-6-methoxyphenol hydroxylase-like FAD-dependent oxidoreductase